MKRTLTLILAFLFLLSACASENPEDTVGETSSADVPEGTVAEAVPEETEYAPDLPDVTYEGEEFRVLYRNNAGSYNNTDVFSEGLTGEVVNDAVYNRNIELEDTYKLTLVPMESGDPVTEAKADHLANSQNYDAMLDQMTAAFPAALQGYSYNWNDLTYVNTEDPWWDSNIARDLTVADKLFLMAGDLTCQPTFASRFVYFNKGILEDYGLEDPYELVRNNQWTIAKMTEMVAAVSTDLDGDGKYTADDCLGMLTEHTDFFLSGCGIQYTERDENGIPTVNFVNERTIAALDAVRNMLTMENCTQSYSQAAAGRDTSGYLHMWDFVRYEYYATGHFLFVQNDTGAALQFAEMDPGYGVLPNPKLDETQETYYHLVDNYSCAWSLPANPRNIEMTDIIFTYWNYLSDEVVDGYYEKTLKLKKFNAPDDAEMLDIIRDTTRYEISMICNLGISSVISNAYSSGNLMSEYAKSEKQINKLIERTFADFIGD